MAELTSPQFEELRELHTNSNGIVSKDGGFQATYTSRILVIGLGGMGLKTLRRLKRELKERVGDISGAYLQLLSLDTDGDDRQKALDEQLLMPAELPLLQNTNLTNHLSAVPEHRPRAIAEIIPDGFKQALNGKGANQVRLAGRLTIMDLSLFQTIYNSISNAITQLQDFTTATLDVHLVAGLGGGSGSGMIIDVPYIVRAVLRNLGVTETKLRLFGHLYLPNAYSGISNPEAAYRNGYAALQEIDYYMNLEAIGESFEATYPDTTIGDNGHFVSEKNIFTRCALIGGKIASPMVIPDPQAAALSVCVEDLVTQCTNPQYSAGNQTGTITDFFSSASFEVNAETALSTVMGNADLHFPKEANYHYNLIGSTSIKFPTEAIIDQFIGEMTERAEVHMNAKKTELTDSDVDAFEAGLIKPSDIVNAQVKTIDEELDAYLNDSNTVWEKKTLNDRTHHEQLNLIVVNALTAFDEDKTLIERIKSSINDKAKKIFTDPQKGPYYLEQLLTSNNNSGGIFGFYQRIGGYYAATQALKTETENEQFAAVEAQGTLSDKMQKLGHFNRNLSAYKEALKQQYIAKFKIALCDRLTQTYYKDLNTHDGVAYIVKHILDKSFLELVEILRSINRIMLANRDIAVTKLDDKAGSDPTSIFALQDPTFDTLKEKVRSTVSGQLMRMGEDAPKKYVGALTATMLDKPEDWVLTEKCPFGKSKCAAAFRTFVKDYAPFSNIVNRKMLDYFNEAYGNLGAGMVAQVIQKLLSVVSFKSAPMCNVWEATHFNFENVRQLRYSYLVLPDGFNTNGNMWGSQFNTLFVGGNVATNNIYWSPDQNAIYCYTLYAKMPLWIHKDLIDYEREYGKVQTPGVHINENPTFTPKWKDYPSPMIPSQWYRTQFVVNNYSFGPEKEMMETVSAKVRYAVRHGIMRKAADGRYEVCTILDKPNPNDGRSKERIDNFVKSYTNDSDNRKEDGSLAIEKNLFVKMCDKFGATTHMIYGGRDGYEAITEDDAIVLLRKQMKLFQLLFDEIEYYKKHFVEALDVIEGGIKKQHNARTFAKYMLFGLVEEERNIWRYKLGEKAYPIIARAEAAREYVNYMEIAANNALWKSESIKAHSGRLNDLVSDRIKRIAYREDDTEPLYVAVKERHAVLATRFNDVLDQITERYNQGNELTQGEIERREFYTVLLDEVNEQMSTFG